MGGISPHQRESISGEGNWKCPGQVCNFDVQPQHTLDEQDAHIDRNNTVCNIAACISFFSYTHVLTCVDEKGMPSSLVLPCTKPYRIQDISSLAAQ